MTLFPLPGFAPPTPLVKAKAAFSFGVHTAVQYSPPPVSGGASGAEKKGGVPVKTVSTSPTLSTSPTRTVVPPTSIVTTSSAGTTFNAVTTIPIPTVLTQLMVGCRRKVVIYTWKDGEAQEVKVRRLPFFLLLCKLNCQQLNPGSTSTTLPTCDIVHECRLCRICLRTRLCHIFDPEHEYCRSHNAVACCCCYGQKHGRV